MCLAESKISCVRGAHAYSSILKYNKHEKMSVKVYNLKKLLFQQIFVTGGEERNALVNSAESFTKETGWITESARLPVGISRHCSAYLALGINQSFLKNVLNFDWPWLKQVETGFKQVGWVSKGGLKIA